jgi:hypothetical protein
MRRLNHKRRQRRRFQLEFLESRQLLSAVGVPAHHVAEVGPLVRSDPKTIKGMMKGTLADFFPTPGGGGSASFVSEGKLEHLGESKFGASMFVSEKATGKVVTYESSPNTGVRFAVASEADEIHIDFTGTGKSTHHKKAEASFKWDGSVTGGTGKYAGATGSFTAMGNLLGVKGEISIKHIKVILNDP